MKTLLIYYPVNKRSVVIETIAAEIKKRGYQVHVLTTSPVGEIHEQLTKLGVRNSAIVYKRTNTVLFYFRHLRYLISFCKKQNVDTVWSHLQGCNMVAVFASYFIRAKVIIFRHHFHAIVKEKGLGAINSNERRMEKIICKLAKQIIVPSGEVYQGMIQYENVPAKKVTIVPYIYDFTKYDQVDDFSVQAIKNEFGARLLILIASRMISMKRHMLVLPVMKKLISEGLDIKVMLLDDGEERLNLEDYVRTEGLSSRIAFLGYRPNVVDYLSASGLIVHPSFTEASSSLIKEAGFAGKPVIVCSGVGDFDEYIIHQKNGFLVKPGNEAAQFEEYIKLCYSQPEIRQKLGQELKETVLRKFTAQESTVAPYLNLL